MPEGYAMDVYVTPSAECGRHTYETPFSSTGVQLEETGIAPVSPNAARLLYLSVQIKADPNAQVPPPPVFVLVFDVQAVKDLRVGQRPLLPPGAAVMAGDSWEFSDPRCERDPDGFPFDKGILVVLSVSDSWTGSAEDLQALRGKITARYQAKPMRHRSG